LQQLLYNRNVFTSHDAEIYINKAGPLHNPAQLTGMETTVNRILAAVAKSEPIAVYGDYDVDGVTATALLVQALQSLRADVRGFIPNRFEEGYGLSKEPLQKLYDDGIRLIITVDCGIRSGREVEFCNALGMDIIITDHHEPRGAVPPALAVICPKQEGDLYPEKNLAGVGLAFKLTEALFHEVPSHTTRETDFLDLVALGTVADIVPLTGENRTLVKAGLQRIKLQQRLGLRALAGVASINQANITARDIGFGLGPRLNASGRMETAQMAFDLLMASDPLVASRLAQQLDDLNRNRQELTRTLVERAEQLVAGQPEADIVIAFDPDFNKGIVGLVASKLVEHYYRPAVVGQIENGEIRASCRSIPEFHITRALDECADLFDHHGGHSMAAGFTLYAEFVDDFHKRMGEIAARELKGLDLSPEMEIDMELSLESVNPRDVFDALAKIEPAGQGNKDALFCSKNIKVDRYKTVGKESTHLKMTLKDGKVLYDAIAFRLGYWEHELPQQIDLVYTFEKNVFRGEETIQLNVKDLRPAE
jgi:single-stranded-DNA-specific exonuclease